MQSIDKPRRLLTLLVSALALIAFGSRAIAAQETVRRPRITGISHVGYFASDLPSAVAFWHDFLGYDESYTLTKKDSPDIRIAFIKINDHQHIELFNEPPTHPPSMMSHLCFSVDDIEQMRTFLRSKGYDVKPGDGGKTRTGDYAFEIKDPNGMLIEFVQSLPDGLEMRAKGKFLPATRISPRIYHAGYLVADANKTEDFYKMLGFTETWRGGANPKELSWINMKVPDGDDYVELMLYRTLPEASKWGGKNHLSLVVTDIDKSVAELKARPYFKIYGKELTIATGVNQKRQANLYDPDGTRVEIMEPNTITGKPTPPSTAPPPPPAPLPDFGSAASAHTFTVSGKQFLFDGKPYQVISGEMHYARIPRAYWRDRLRKARAMGLNTITTYVFWNLHEPRPGVYDFSGEKDIAEYIREAQQEGLHVILRPGPYVCAEWELGGYPSWLLKDRSVVLRSTDPTYTAAVQRWFTRLAQEIKPLLLANGGPIIAVQVENEYGSFGDDQVYLEGVKKQLIDSGMGDTLLYTANPANDLTRGSLPELPTVINFGTGDAQKSFAKLDQLRPDGPRMSGEYWAGWFDKWGEPHHETDGQREAAEFRWMLEHGYSVSLYMFHGGTTFGWMNGADSHTGKDYHPDTTSYDYNAPLNERGEPTYKFELFRKAIADVTHATPPALPKLAPHGTFAIAPGMLTASLWRNLPTPVNSKIPLTFEDLDQNFGYVLYRTGIDAGDGGKLVLGGLHDYAQVYVDQALVGTLDRRLGVETLDLPRQTHAATLDILVENTGRVNYSKAILTERTGLTGEVTLDGKAPKSWEIYSLPMEDLSHLRFLPEPCSGPCFFRASMNVPQPADTYLDTRGLHKGQLWVGTHNLGRFWSVGPEYALYTPAPWLEQGTTALTFFDLTADSSDRLTTSVDPIFGETKRTRDTQ